MLDLDSNKPTLKTVFTDPFHFFAFGFGSGLAPWAPGTFGTLVALPFFYLMSGLNPWVYIAIVVALFVAGIYICDVSEKRLGIEDYKGIVWDEVVGMLIALWWLPFDWLWIGLAFIAFRFFDILKPWPCSWSDRRIKGGIGIMMDDVLAGIYALLVVQGIIYWVGV